MLIQEKINLLYIEDDSDSAAIINEYLSQSKHTKFDIVHKYTLKEALEFMEVECANPETCEVDAILLDLILPNSHGVNTYKEVSKRSHNIPVVIISGHEDIACECVKLGAQDYLIKPDLNGGLVARSIQYAIERNKLQNKYRNIIDTSTLGYLIYKLEKDVLVFSGFNPAANEILGVDCEMFMGRTIYNAFPKLPPEIPENFMITARDGIPYTNQIIEYDDEKVKKAYYKFDAYKTAKNTIVVTFEDVSKLVETEEKFRNLVEFTKAGIYKIDFVQNKFTYVNDIICQQLGYTREELMGMGPYDILTPHSVDEWFKRWEALQRGEFIENSFEYEAVRKDGSIAWALITAEYIEDENKNIIGANVVAIDITDKKLAQKEAKEKEEIIFSELEKRIHQWKTEMIEVSKVHQNTIESVDSNLRLITNVTDVEVL